MKTVLERPEQILYTAPKLLSRNIDKEISYDGHKINMVHRFGHESHKRQPLLRTVSYEVLEKLTKALAGGNHGFHPYSEKWIVQKWKERYIPGIGHDAVFKLQRKGYGLFDIIRKLGVAPYEIHIGHGKPIVPLNLMLNEGIDEIWDLATQVDSTNYYTNALARVGVGNSTTAASASQTGLQGGSTAFAVMDSTYPTSTSQKINLKGSFPDTFAEFAWEEGTADNGGSSNKNLNRLVQTKGTKPTGETWTSEIQITGS